MSGLGLCFIITLLGMVFWIVAWVLFFVGGHIHLSL